ncbi:MAG TPA: c-type cytochrome [Candidatus Limnocylindria bacterium]|jgi:mono/diheme cytochrome c family protein|nr:c-type cytochrome [Candidatus Limnocylindria bacterium]
MDINVVLAVVSVLLFAGFLAFFGFLVFHQQQVEPKEPTGAEIIEQHYAPGETVEQPTPYYVAPIPAAPDPLEISANLDKKILLGAGMLFAVFALVGAYFFTLFSVRADATSERWRDRVASAHQTEKSIERGRNLYANFCFDCHGKTGLGSTDPERKDLPGLPLNKPAFKFENIKNDPTKLKATQDLLTLTISRGRAKPPGTISMPPWSDKEGGSLNDEQIQQLVNFIMLGSDDDWADVVTVRLHSEGAEDGHLPLEPNPPKVPVLTGIELGKALTLGNPTAACVTCHSFTPGTPSTLPQAPNLGRYGTEGPINDENKARKAGGDSDWLLHWIQNAPSVKPGIPMPAFSASAGGSLSDEQIKAIIEYLMSLK